MISCVALLAASLVFGVYAQNSTYQNPILPGFHPDPSCIFVPEWDDTFFCASSSFLAFPGLPIHASKDLRKWRLASNAFSRPEQLPDLANLASSLWGIWAPTLRYRNGTFYLVTTNVINSDASHNLDKWDNIILTSTDPYNSSSWSNPVHFDFFGYDTSPFWDDDGKVYITGSHPWQHYPAIRQMQINLETGAVGEPVIVWNGTGGLAPEGPHIYKRDGYYYLMVAEGGTGVNHMQTIARSKNINGPYDPNPANPIVTNANTSAYFQTVGHADLFQDKNGEWWGVALSTRSGPDYLVYPMGRETVLTAVTWKEGGWPIFTNVSGSFSGWELDKKAPIDDGEGALIDEPDHITFKPGSKIPPHLTHWRLPVAENYAVSPPGHPNTLRLRPSIWNVTGANSTNFAQPKPQTWIARRQVDSLFTFSVDVDFSLKEVEQEVGVTVFLDQNRHYDLGIVLLPTSNGNSSTGALAPHLRLDGRSPWRIAAVTQPISPSWLKGPLTLEIKAFNLTHFSLSAGPASRPSELQTFGYAPGAGLSWGFTGVFVGVYATTNGRNGTFDAYISEWKYTGQGQVIS